MWTPQELIEHIMHVDPTYSPQKAHEYYLRTRELVGRQPGVAAQPAKVTSAAKPAAAPLKKAAPVAAKPAASKQSAVDAQMTALQARFDKLKEVLASLVAAAKARSGVDSKAASKAPTKETAAQTKKRSDAAKKYYDAHKNDKPQTPDAQLKALQQKIADISAKIKKLQAEAAAAKKPAAKPAAKPVSKKPAPKPVAKKPAPKPVAKKPAPKPAPKPVIKPQPGRVGKSIATL